MSFTVARTVDGSNGITPRSDLHDLVGDHVDLVVAGTPTLQLVLASLDADFQHYRDVVGSQTAPLWLPGVPRVEEEQLLTPSAVL